MNKLEQVYDEISLLQTEVKDKIVPPNKIGRILIHKALSNFIADDILKLIFLYFGENKTDISCESFA